jgi:hypothetical protein
MATIGVFSVTLRHTLASDGLPFWMKNAKRIGSNQILALVVIDGTNFQIVDCSRYDDSRSKEVDPACFRLKMC